MVPQGVSPHTLEKLANVHSAELADRPSPARSARCSGADIYARPRHAGFGRWPVNTLLPVSRAPGAGLADRPQRGTGLADGAPPARAHAILSDQRRECVSAMGMDHRAGTGRRNIAQLRSLLGHRVGDSMPAQRRGLSTIALPRPSSSGYRGRAHHRAVATNMARGRNKYYAPSGYRSPPRRGDVRHLGGIDRHTLPDSGALLAEPAIQSRRGEGWGCCRAEMATWLWLPRGTGRHIWPLAQQMRPLRGEKKDRPSSGRSWSPLAGTRG